MNGYNIEGNINQTLGKLDETINNVKSQAGSAFGLDKQIDQRPWIVIGAALVAGYVLGSAGGRHETESTQWRTSDHASRHEDTDNKKASRAAGNPTQSQLYFSAPSTSSHSPEHTSPEGSNWKPDTTNAAAFSAATPPPPAKPQQNLIPESMNKHIDTAISTAGTTVRGMLRDAIRDNVPSMRDQVDALDRRDGRTPA